MAKTKRSRERKSNNDKNISLKKTMVALWAIGALTDNGKPVISKCEQLLKVLESNSSYTFGNKYNKGTMQKYINQACDKGISKEQCSEMVDFLYTKENCRNVWEIIEAAKTK